MTQQSRLKAAVIFECFCFWGTILMLNKPRNELSIKPHCDFLTLLNVLATLRDAAAPRTSYKVCGMQVKKKRGDTVCAVSQFSRRLVDGYYLLPIVILLLEMYSYCAFTVYSQRPSIHPFISEPTYPDQGGVRPWNGRSRSDFLQGSHT